MEQIYPFLHEDILYIINEYARENTKKKELCQEIFSEFLSINLMKVKIRVQWITLITSIGFKNINEFLNFLEIARTDFEDRGNRLVYYDENTVKKLVQYYKVPLGPRVKVYHYFINNYRFNSDENRTVSEMEERLIDMMMDAII
jgi:hypothetical protein